MSGFFCQLVVAVDNVAESILRSDASLWTLAWPDLSFTDDSPHWCVPHADYCRKKFGRADSTSIDTLAM